jgi:hypothetical protein
MKTQKQDRQGVRTPADIERKYDLAFLGEGGSGGGSGADVSELVGELTQLQTFVKSINRKLDGIMSGWNPNVYLGSDKDGKLAEKPSPTIEAERSESGVTLTITDAEGTKTAELYDGAKGDPYELTEEDMATIVDAVLDAYPSGDEVEY